MKPAAFTYHAPETAAETVALLTELGDEAKIIAGGQSLVPMMALRLAAFEHLIDLRKVTELRGIDLDGDTVRVGAGTTHASVGRDEHVRHHVPLLHRATPLIGHFQIRNRGTIGGAIAHADAAAEYPAVALTLDARMRTLSPRGERIIDAADYFTGLWSTGMAPDEMLVGIDFPAWPGRRGFAIEEFTRRAGDFAMAGATVAIALDADSRIERVGIGLFGLAPTPLRARSAEAELLGRPAAEVDAEEIGRAATADLDAVPADVHGSADYRRRVGAVMVTRAWRRALEEANDD
ncbi:FAD binding domain-containing protein [Nocardia higoensis]|uniref:FAD binding domain-containing protein n=1 Tax=Nocardia higoensis TaxID=228599 RepID=UPI0002F6011F|nr:xanthine dehydrogenase family protein subunit M [Nocardia higoensis]